MSASPATSPTVPVVVLGATGYVGGELLRLVAAHPRLALACAVSESRGGEAIAAVFPHLAPVLPGATFAAPGSALEHVRGAGPLVVLGALPHGAAAAPLAALIGAAHEHGRELFVCDLSADFRLGSAARFEEVYGQEHGAPELADTFTCAPPELGPTAAPAHVAHPGCFTTAVSLGAHAVLASGLVEPRVVASCVTGSTGSGRSPTARTHHPERHGDMVGYGALGHRHRHEMEDLLGGAEVVFLPHSGPFSRGIHATLAFRLAAGARGDDVAEQVRARWAGTPFVTVVDEPPRVKTVAGTNHALLSVTHRGRDLVVHAVLDNLLKGAAGGAVQWVNRRFGWDETTGLDHAAPAWM